MTDGTKILMVEDSAQDAEILLHHLRREGLAFHHLRVETERELRAALRDFAPSVVLSDFAMPGFDGMSALAVCRELAPETPFIFVSGHIGEEMAVGAMKAGAADYVMKGNLAKVGPAVTRELKDAAARRERRHAEGALRRAQAMAELAHVVTGPEGDFLSWSETLPALAGVEASEMPKSTRAWLELIHADDREAFRAASILAATTGQRVHVEYRLRRASGAWIHVRQAIEPEPAGNGAQWFSTLLNVTAEKDAEEKIRRLAYYDAVTGLANRTLFHERLEQAIAAAAREHRKLAVLLHDIERFKTINDTLGRPAGDALLRQVAERFSAAATDAAWLGRLAADQFAMWVPDVTTEEELVRRMARRQEGLFGQPYPVQGNALRLSARMGIAMYPTDGADADTLLRNAESALKKAKATGERYLFYTQEMTDRVAERLSLENKLRAALEKDEFVLHYQPKVDLETRAITGVEALLRWQSPELGLVAPQRFIPLLEETGLILEVGAWALRKAASDRRAWLDAGLRAPRVAVNVSAIQLRQRHFVDVMRDAAVQGSVPVGLDVEITESLIMENIEANIVTLEELRRLGVGIAIDDFGTGYSSLAYLAKLPVQTLKIDRTFVAAMLTNSNTTTLVQTIISMAHTLRLKVVAEGVETDEQARMLRLLRCDQMQGNLFSKPVPAFELVAFL